MHRSIILWINMVRNNYTSYSTYTLYTNTVMVQNVSQIHRMDRSNQCCHVECGPVEIQGYIKFHALRIPLKIEIHIVQSLILFLVHWMLCNSWHLLLFSLGSRFRQQDQTDFLFRHKFYRQCHFYFIMNERYASVPHDKRCFIMEPESELLFY